MRFLELVLQAIEPGGQLGGNADHSPLLVTSFASRATPPARPACDRPPPTPVDVVRGSDGQRSARVGMDFRRRPRPGREPRAAQRTVATPPGLCNGSPRLERFQDDSPATGRCPTVESRDVGFPAPSASGEFPGRLGQRDERFRCCVDQSHNLRFGCVYPPIEATLAKHCGRGTFLLQMS